MTQSATETILGNTNFKCLSLLLLLICPLTLLGQTETVRKIEKRKFRITPNTHISVNNKYGNVEVYNWENDSVQFVVEVTVSSRDSAEAHRVLTDIDFDFASSAEAVQAETVLESRQSGFFQTDKQFAEEIMASDIEVNINYTVKVPAYVDLTVSNKYGDVYIQTLNGQLNLTHSNGDLKIDNVRGQATIDLKFGKGQINQANQLTLTSLFSSVDIKKVTQLTSDSKSSVIEIEQADLIKLQSKRDKIYIRKADFLYGSSYFTMLKAAAISAEVKLTASFGSLSFESIPTSVVYFNIESTQADLSLCLRKGAAYSITCLTKGTQIQAPLIRFEDCKTAQNDYICKTARTGTPDDKAPRILLVVEQAVLIMSLK